MTKMRASGWLAVFFAASAFGSGTTGKQIDNLQNSTGGSSLSVPSVGTAVVSDTATQTIQNKTINGANNTLSQLPVATQTIQVLLSPYPNSSTTVFTLSTAPGAAIGVHCAIDGMVLLNGSGKDFSVSGSTVTFTAAPVTGQQIICWYSAY